MDSSNKPAQGNALNTFRAETARPSAGQETEMDVSARNPSATGWQMGRLVNNLDQPVPAVKPEAGPAPLDRISQLLRQELVLVRTQSFDSMAVVLRPDPETELVVHFTRRGGEIEAAVRCERGDYQQLSGLWPQLQESLAQQKVRLAPLQESSSGQPGLSSGGSGSHLTGNGGESSRQAGAEKRSMDEWPAPASSNPPHVRGRGGSRRRLTTSRPGWETWA